MPIILKTLELGKVCFKSNPEIIRIPLLHSLSHVLLSLNTATFFQKPQVYGFPYHNNHNHNNPNNQDHHNHHSHPHYDLQGLRLCGTSRLLPTDEGLTVGREQRTYLWRIKSINKFQKSYFLSSLWHTVKSFGSSIFAFGAFCTYEFVFVFCISVFFKLL